MIAQAPLWFEQILDGWWGTVILTLFCVLDVGLLSVIFYRAFMKRVYDFVLALAGIVLLLPVWLFLTPVVALKMKGNPFFVQPRPGKKGRIFKLLKYRTMTEEKDAAGEPLPDAERLTAFGSFLRRLSLDELPELFNILLGQMSLVGPRPLLVQYLPLYTPRQAHRHAVRPGLTGLAQVSGRNALDWETRLALDVAYVDRYSFFGDLKILALTVVKVCRREGISEEGQATKACFTGGAAAASTERDAAAADDGGDRAGRVPDGADSEDKIAAGADEPRSGGAAAAARRQAEAEATAPDGEPGGDGREAAEADRARAEAAAVRTEEG